MKKHFFILTGILLSIAGFLSAVFFMIFREGAGGSTVIQEKLSISAIQSIMVDMSGNLYCMGDKSTILVFSNDGKFKYSIAIPLAGKGEAEMDIIEDFLCIRDQENTVYQYKGDKLVNKVQYDDSEKIVTVYNAGNKKDKEIRLPVKANMSYELVASIQEGIIVLEYGKFLDSGKYFLINSDNEKNELNEDIEFYEEYSEAEDTRGNVFSINGVGNSIKKKSVSGEEHIIYQISGKYRFGQIISVGMFLTGILILLVNYKMTFEAYPPKRKTKDKI